MAKYSFQIWFEKEFWNKQQKSKQRKWIINEYICSKHNIKYPVRKFRTLTHYIQASPHPEKASPTEERIVTPPPLFFLFQTFIATVFFFSFSSSLLPTFLPSLFFLFFLLLVLVFLLLSSWFLLAPFFPPFFSSYPNFPSIHVSLLFLLLSLSLSFLIQLVDARWFFFSCSCMLWFLWFPI